MEDCGATCAARWRAASAINARQRAPEGRRGFAQYGRSRRRAARGARGGLYEVGERGFRQPTVNDVVDRSRLQIIRADELLTRTLDRVEDASEIVHKTVVSPVRQVSGLLHGVTAGIEFFFAGRGRRNGGNRESRRPVPQDEMFI